MTLLRCEAGRCFKTLPVLRDVSLDAASFDGEGLGEKKFVSGTPMANDGTISLRLPEAGAELGICRRWAGRTLVAVRGRAGDGQVVERDLADDGRSKRRAFRLAERELRREDCGRLGRFSRCAEEGGSGSGAFDGVGTGSGELDWRRDFLCVRRMKVRALTVDAGRAVSRAEVEKGSWEKAKSWSTGKGPFKRAVAMKMGFP